MGSRTFHIAIILFWLTSMTWLIVAKVLPPLLVGEPPTYRSTMSEPSKVIAWEIYWNDKPLGWAATRTDMLESEMSEIHNRVVLEELPLGELLPSWLNMLVRHRVGHLDLDAYTRMDIDPLGHLDGFRSTVKLSGISNVVQMRGRVQDGNLNTSVQVGEINYDNKFTLEPGALVSGDFSPVSSLPGLRVGQTWTVRSFSPLKPPNGPMETLQAVVTGEEWVQWNDRELNALVVEYRSESGAGLTANGPPRSKMWVLPDGRIIRQEITVLTSVMRFIRLVDEQALQYADELEERNPFHTGIYDDLPQEEEAPAP